MEENTKQKNLENNTLSIVDEPISKDKINDINSINKNNEILPIKKIKSFKSAEEYYSINYPDFKLYKIKGILFCKIGTLLSFNFDKNNNFIPKMSIGPHWYMTLLLNILIILVGSTLYILIITNLHYLYRIGYLFFYIIVIIFLNRAALIHPGLAMNKSPDINNYSFCDKCKIYFNPNEKVEHCNFCKVCIKNMDHHCVWVGKCVGENNVKSFYQMIIVVGIFYIYIIICIIIFNVRKN